MTHNKERKHQKTINAMSLPEKASLMSGANFWNTQAIEHLGIPSLMLTDGPHGIRKQAGKADHLGLNKSKEATCFPTAATLANSWDETLIRSVGSALGKEAAHENIAVLLGPGLNIKRNPLCGRNFEYFSEDPYLSGKLASAMIQGIQEEGVAACPKHFAVNSQELHRMSVDEIVDQRALHELYLEGFRISICEGKARTIMSAYNKVNGIYANESDPLLQDVLRGQWGFKGLIVTDWGGNNDRVAGLKSGNQLEMPSTNGMTDKDIIKAIETQELDIEILNDRVEEFLQFVEDAKTLKKETPLINFKEHHELARKAARESIVLLKNEGHVLPLNLNQSIALIGDFAATPRYQGAGSSLINPTEVDSLCDAFEASEYNILGYERGFERFGKTKKKLETKAMNLAQQADTIVLFLGLDESRETEGVDRRDMKLAENQIHLLESLARLKKPIVLVLAGGAPVELPFWDQVDACVHGYLPGQAGGKAILDVLSGIYNPSGKLAETYPLVYEDTPSAPYFPGKEVSSEHRESIFVGYRYFDSIRKEVRFPFGFGLSYTNFEYGYLKVNENSVEIDITNSGNVYGEEVVQVYIAAQNSHTYRPEQELKGFAKVGLKAYETKTLTIPLSNHAFSIYDATKKEWVVEAGLYDIRIGGSSRDLRLSETVIKEGLILNAQANALNRVYFDKDIQNISKESFESLLDFRLPNPLWDRNKVLDANDIVEQSRYASRFGRFINFLIEKLRDFFMFRKKPIAANNVLFAQNIPFRGIARMSNGIMNMRMLDGLLLMSNGHFFKGLWMLIVNKFKKEQ